MISPAFPTTTMPPTRMSYLSMKPALCRLPGPQGVGEEAQAALGGQPRVEQFERAGRRVARVGERLQPLGDAVAVEPGQVGAVHVHLAAGLQERYVLRQR